MPVRCRLLSLLLGACAPAPPSDAQVYAELVGAAAPVLERDLPRCRALAHPDSAGDCELAVARRAAGAEGLAPTAHCDEIAAGAWRDECWFLGAEDLLRARQPNDAADACLKAGRFRDECAQHMWQRELRTAAGRPGHTDLIGRLPRAAAVYDKWSALLGTDTDLEVRLWRRWYELGHDGQTPLDPNLCTPLDGVDRARCRESLRWIHARRLMDLSHRPDGRQALCDGEDPSARVHTVADPLFAPVQAELVPRICEQGLSMPAEDGVVGTAAFLAATRAAAGPAPY